MKFGRRAEKPQPSAILAEPEQGRVRLPTTVAAQCLGARCVNFTGVDCQSRLELLQADGASGGPDLPPYVDDATFVIRGQVCIGGDKDKLVAIRAEALEPDVNPSMLVALGGMYGLPLTIQAINRQTYGIQTIADSQKQPDITH